MLKPRETEEILAFLARLVSEQEKTMLSGSFNKIEEYKAAAAVVRNLKRIQEAIEKIYAGAEAAEAKDDLNLIIQPEKDTTR